jgi:ABC-2 type transport system ATP-binding protein
MIAIEAKDLSKNYGAVRALDRVSFTIEEGEVIGLLGPNGAGKTTLMKVLTGYLQPDEGSAQVRGVDVVDDPLGVQAKIGYLPENAPLYGEMTVQEYLQMMAAMRGIEPADQRRLLSDAIHATGLADYLVRPIGKLSKGYRQRVGIAQAILHRPKILILDEPTTGLDPTQIVEIRNLIKSLAADATVLLSTHILSEVEATCERVLVIMQGRLRTYAELGKLRASNAAVVAIEDSASGVKETLAAISGVSSVDPAEAAVDGFRRWRVTSERADLCPAVFEALRDKKWKVAELRSDAKTLEKVFRELAETPIDVVETAV